MLATEPAITSPAEPVRPDSVDGAISLRDATFSYPGADRPVLQDVSLTARPGTTTAIVGSTGSGKSTLVSLICRMYDVTDGAVHVDGIDVRDYDTEQLWSDDRACAATGLPVLRDRRRQPALRQGRRDRRRDVGGVAGGVGGRLRPVPRRRPRHAGRPGRHQLLRRSAATAGDRARRHPQAGHLPVRRRLLGARRAHRRQGARRPWRGIRRRDGCHRLATDFDGRRGRSDRRDRRRQGRRHRDARHRC